MSRRWDTVYTQGGGKGRVTPTELTAMKAVLLPAIFLALAPAAHASTWTSAKTFTGGSGEDAAPRAAITAAGASTVAWRRADGRLVMTVGNAAGRFRAPKAIAKGVFDWAVAPG